MIPCLFFGFFVLRRSLLTNCTCKNPVFVRWLGGSTPVRSNEYVYVASKIALHSTVFHRHNLAVADKLFK